MRSAPTTLERRWAKIRVVRSRISRSSASWMTASLSASTDDRASSRMRIGVSRRSARALAAGQTHAALAHDGVVALGQPLDELVGVGGPRRGPELRRCRGRLTHAKVILDGAVEEIGILAHHGDCAP